MARRVKQVWADLLAGGTPTSAARFNDMESGIFNVDYRAAARVTHNTTQSISNNTITALAFNTDRFDQENNAASTIHDTVTNNSRLTCRTAGVYLIMGNLEWAASATNAELAIRLNGTGASFTTQIAYRQVVGDERRGQIETLWALNVNEYVEFMVRHNAGVSVTVNSSANYSPEFMMALIA